MLDVVQAQEADAEAEMEALWESPDIVFEDEYGPIATASESRDPNLYSPTRACFQAVVTRSSNLATCNPDSMEVDTVNPILENIHDRIDHTTAGINSAHERVDEVEYHTRNLAARLEDLERRMGQEEKNTTMLERRRVAQEYEIREVHRQVAENKDMIENGFGLRKHNGRLWHIGRLPSIESQKTRLREKICETWGFSDDQFIAKFGDSPGLSALKGFMWIAERHTDVTEGLKLLEKAKEARHQSEGKSQKETFTLTDAIKAKAMIMRNTPNENKHPQSGQRRSSRLATSTKGPKTNGMKLRSKRVIAKSTARKSTGNIAAHKGKGKGAVCRSKGAKSVRRGDRDKVTDPEPVPQDESDASAVPYCLAQEHEWLDLDCITQLLKIIVSAHPSVYVLNHPSQEITASTLLERPAINLVLLPFQVCFKRWALAVFPLQKTANGHARTETVRVYRSFPEEQYDRMARTVVRDFLHKMRSSWREQQERLGAGPCPISDDHVLTMETCPAPPGNEPFNNGIVTLLAAMHVIAGKRLPEVTDLAVWRRMFRFLCGGEAGCDSVFDALAVPASPDDALTGRKKLAGLRAYADAMMQYNNLRDGCFVTSLHMQSVLAWFEGDLQARVEEKTPLVASALMVLQHHDTDVLRQLYEGDRKELTELEEMLVRVKRCREVVRSSLKKVPCKISCFKENGDGGSLLVKFRI
ncbi:hypothetical protein QBC41DRAFT_338349 [Cercophora samala]|uniref:Uncharacterized protein n=1 Tax=Cercophora samala TaxID=330535 RepID=A0AA39ZAT9_9PEZI|nr:hypothetical protein QBC41DRAFT_338349 [Cercophora samala]